MNLTGKRILLLGGSGLLGMNLQERFKKLGLNFWAPSHDEVNVLDKNSLYQASIEEPDIVINAFVLFGGIKKNEEHPYRIFYDNLQGNLNVIDVFRKTQSVKKFIQISSQCIYGDKQPVPFKEEDLWNFGLPTGNNAPYGIAKRTLHMAIDSARKEFGFNGIVVVPSNMYGPHDNFHPEHTHVIPALIQRFLAAKEKNLDKVEIYGNGKSTREFLFAEDCVDAIIKSVGNYDSSEPINIGTGKEITILDLAEKIKRLTGFKGEIACNQNGLDGQLRRVSDVQKAKERFDFEAKTDLEEGLAHTIAWYLNNKDNCRRKVYYT